MKIAVTSKGPSPEANLDPRFGRAAYILIMDTESGSIEVIDNQVNANAFKGAGIQTATLLNDKGAEVLLTGYCGPNAFKTLAAVNIKVADGVSGTVQEAVAAFERGSLTYADGPNRDGHW